MRCDSFSKQKVMQAGRQADRRLFFGFVLGVVSCLLLVLLAC